MTPSEKENLIKVLKIIIKSEDIELIKIMLESIIEKLEDSNNENN